MNLDHTMVNFGYGLVRASLAATGNAKHAKGQSDA